MSFVAVAAVATVGSAAYGAYSAHKASTAQEKAQNTAISGQQQFESDKQARLAELAAHLDLGKKPIPAEYQPVDFTKEQLNSITGSASNLDAIQQLVHNSNKGLRYEDIQRIKQLVPGFKNLLRSEGSATGSLLNGQLPYDDVLGIASDRASLAGSLGIPGASGSATLKDLGLSRLDAIKAGGGMFKDMVGIAQQVSPIERYARPTDFFISPEQRIRDTVGQNELIQQSTQSKNNIDAAPDPTAVGRQQLQLAAILGQGAPITPQPVPQPDYSKYAMQAIAGLYGGYNAGAFGGHYGATNVGTGGTYGLPNTNWSVYRPTSITA